MKPAPQVSFSKKTFQTMKFVEQSMRRRCFFVCVILTSAVLFVSMLLFNALAGNPSLIKDGPFHHSIGNISSMYPLRITPAGWAFSIWGLIYLLQLGTTLYSLGLLCRTTESGQPAYMSPTVLSPLYFILVSLGCCFNVVWLFMWDRFMFSSSFLTLALQTLVLFSALSISSTRLAFFRTDLVDTGRKLDVCVIQACVLNGLGMYATWSTIATLINFGVAAVYRWNIGLCDEKVSCICLVVLFGLATMYFALDVTAFDRYTRRTFSPYATIIWALSAILSKNWNMAQTSSLICAVILGLVVVLFVAKLAVVICRENKMMNPYRRLKIGSSAGQKGTK